MKSFDWRKGLLSVLLCFTIVIAGCQTQIPSQFAQAQKESTARNAPPAVAKNATQGSEFNKFFPKPQSGYDRVYTQEKKGFAEAKLNKDGKNIAMLAISDTKSIPGSASKYDNATEQISNYPAVDLGTTQTGILVGSYQVKVISKSPDFDRADRVAWIQKFDLNGLSKLK